MADGVCQSSHRNEPGNAYTDIFGGQVEYHQTRLGSFDSWITRNGRFSRERNL